MDLDKIFDRIDPTDEPALGKWAFSSEISVSRGGYGWAGIRRSRGGEYRQKQAKGPANCRRPANWHSSGEKPVRLGSHLNKMALAFLRSSELHEVPTTGIHSLVIVEC